MPVILTNLESFRNSLVKFPSAFFLIGPAVADLFRSEGQTRKTKLTVPSVHLRNVTPFVILLEYLSTYLLATVTQEHSIHYK
jgi:hypothetical protein